MNLQKLAACAALALGLAAPAQAADIDLSPDRGLRVRFPSLDTTLRLGGRLHLDYALFEDDQVPIDDDFDVRRGRLYLDGRVAEDWHAKVEFDFAAINRGWRSVWVGYDGIRRTRLRAGNHTMPFGLEEVGSSNDTLFAERSLASALAPSFGTGASLSTRGKLWHRSRWLVSGGGFIEPFGNTSYDRHRSEHASFAGRAVVAPWVRKRQVVHLGGSFQYRDVIGDDTWRVSRRPGSALAPRLLDVTLSDVDSVMSFGAEAALLLGPVLVQGEYLRAEIEREGGSALDEPAFDGGYVQASWVVTGERHRYSRATGTFGGVKPRNWWGAFEVAGRWGTLDLDDSGVVGGEADDLSVGLNWYLRRNLRLLFNYVRVDAEQSGTREADDPQIFQFRFMYFL
jgi:phosphate-selective porin OprO/OprP